MGSHNSSHNTARGTQAAQARARDGGPTKADLYARAKSRKIPNRSKMSKKQLEKALR